MKVIQQPSAYDVIVTENMFGDILTDEASVLGGSIGVLPSASLGAPAASGKRPGLYEPIHGSAPDIAGLGRANPVGMILSAAMMLRTSLGLEQEADLVEKMVFETIAAGITTPRSATPWSSASPKTKQGTCWRHRPPSVDTGTRGGGVMANPDILVL
jgi:3-isopropylmalate dehydrogenase